jgi:hypothetical protein
MKFIEIIKRLFEKPHDCNDHWIPGYDNENRFMDEDGHKYMGVRYCAKCGKRQHLVYHTIGNIRYEWRDDKICSL